MRKLTQWSRLAAVLAVLGTAGCKSLEVTNPNAPDAERAFSDPGAVAGLLTFALPEARLMWFRPEVIQTVDWGGDPTKPVEAEDGMLELAVPEEHEIKKGKWSLEKLPHLPPKFALAPMDAHKFVH